MSELNGPDPLDRLRAADPIRPDDVPAASLARVSARIQEHIMTDSPRTTPTATPSNRRPFALFGGLALTGALALAVLFGNGLGAVAPTPTDGPTDGPGGGGGMASCLIYDPSTLPTMETVFDGVVTAIDGDKVTFDVKTGWKGVGDRVTLTDPEYRGFARSATLPDFEVGGRYLVTAAGGNDQRVRLHAGLRREDRVRMGGGLRRLTPNHGTQEAPPLTRRGFFTFGTVAPSPRNGRRGPCVLLVTRAYCASHVTHAGDA